MIGIGPIVFLVPMVLIGLLTLPILWWLLRATPPSPLHVKFPGVRLLLGLVDQEKMPDRTPWWLLLLRMLAIAAAIFAFAEPVMHPDQRPDGEGPLLILMDGGWASAGDWDNRVAEVENLIEEAARNGRPTAFMSLARAIPVDSDLAFLDARDWLPELRALEPAAWAPDRVAVADWLEGQQGYVESIWVTDNLEYQASNLGSVLSSVGSLRVVGTDSEPLALRPLTIDDGKLIVTITGAPSEFDRPVTATVFGNAPSGVEVRLAELTDNVLAGENLKRLEFDLPLELRNRVTRVVLAGQDSAGAVVLADDGLRRRKVALVGGGMQDGPQLIDPMFYLRKALEPTVEIVDGDIADIILTAPDVIVLPDIGELSISSKEKLITWMEKGGQLVRFAGPRLAASGLGQLAEDPLLPVRLRAGGRSLGGAMSWGTPKPLEEFSEDSPFFGLTIPTDVTVSSQVVAQPSPDLAKSTLASLIDGTPLVTAKSVGEGRVILFHVTANAEWSTLPLSGLFVQMLERLSISSGGETTRAELIGRRWVPTRILDGYGRLSDPETAIPIDGERLADLPVGIDAAPGIYQSGDLGVAVNTLRSEDTLTALTLPTGTAIELIGRQEEQALKPWFILAAIGLLMLDILGTLWVSGRLRNVRAAHAAAGLLLALLLPAPHADAQDDLAAIRAANDTVLAYVITGDSAIDRVSEAGLYGLSIILSGRTSIEPVEPVGVNIDTDELAFYPLIYWPITDGQSDLSPAAIDRLNRFMASGGTIFFDTRDGNLGNGFGSGTANGRTLQRIAASLDIPPLEPIPEDHVLTRAFYLLQDFPGRWIGPDVWVEVSVGANVDGIPFNHPNDGVTPVIIGSNDWAAGWAVEDNGSPMFSVGRGTAGGRQRELAFRFGVNLVMYIMTGNYKSDQVHVPALLERLGE